MANWNISASAIRNPIPPIMLILGLLLAGLTAYFRLPVNQFPNIDVGVLTVTVAAPGAAPSEMETQIAQRVEAALSSVTGIDKISSTLTPGVSVTTVELRFGANLDRAVEDARDAMNRVRADLPANIQEPQIQRIEVAASPIGYYAVRAEGKTDEEISYFIDNTLTQTLLTAPGVSQVKRLGGADKEIRIDLDPERLTAYGVTAAQISQQVRARNIDLPAGESMLGGQAQSIRTLGSAKTIEDLRELRINTSDGHAVRLTDLGVVAESASDLDSIARLNGQPVVSFMIQRANGSSSVSVAHAAEAKIAEIERENPGYHIVPIYEDVDFIEAMHESSMASLIEGAFLAVAVVFLVLRDWRATFIAAMAIPLSTIPTFAVMEPLGFTLNLATLIALALVAGVLVDDAIVEIENIVRHIHMGKRPYDAAMEAADEIGLAVVATTSAVVAVFLPVSFLPGNIGQFFREFGLTVAIAALFSLLVARLITPMMAAFLLRDVKHEKPPGVLMDTYRAVLGWSIRKPLSALGMGIGIFVVSILLAFPVFLNFTFIPRWDNGLVQINVEPPPGARLQDSDRTLQRMAAEIARLPQVSQTFSQADSVEGAATSGNLQIILTPHNERNISNYQIQGLLRPILARFPDYRTNFLNAHGGGTSADVTLQFLGRDPDAVNAAGQQLLAEMETIPGLVEMRSSAALKRPEIHVEPRLEDASRLGVTASDISSALRIATSGDIEQNLPRFDLPDRQIPIHIAIREDARSNIDVLRALPVASATGAPVRLDAVANVSYGLGEASIERHEQQRAVTISANISDPHLNPGTAAQKVMELPTAKNPPPGVQLVTSGQTEDTQKMFESFGMAMLWGVLMIYAVLVLLFRDFFQPFTIMTALPLSLGGAFLGLLIGNQPLSLFALIGLIMLMGIVTKNSILLVDFAIEQIHKGMPRDEALMDSGMKRARPIIMTTFAMVAGMLPTAAGFGVDGALRQGMAMAVIGGLLLSTVLSLVFVPAVFILIDRLERRLKGMWSHPSQRETPPPHPAE